MFEGAALDAPSEWVRVMDRVLGIQLSQRNGVSVVANIRGPNPHRVYNSDPEPE
jgi:hypothetical protein